VRLADDQTPTGEKRYAQVVIPHGQLVHAYMPKIVFDRYISELVHGFNQLPGKKVKVVQTAEEMDEERVPMIMLPYRQGLIYYSDAIA
jgi:hypothetical protein